MNQFISLVIFLILLSLQSGLKELENRGLMFATTAFSNQVDVCLFVGLFASFKSIWCCRGNVLCDIDEGPLY